MRRSQARRAARAAVYNSENVVCPWFSLPDVGEGGEALRLRAARIAAGFDEAARFVDLRAGDEALRPVGGEVDVVAAAAQLVDYLGAEARLDAHAVRHAPMRREEAGEVLARQARRL